MKVLIWIVVTFIFEVNSDVYLPNGSTDISTSSESGLPLEKQISYRVHIHKKFNKWTKIILKFDADASVKLSDKSFARIRPKESNNIFIINFYKAHEDIVLEVQGLTPGVVPHFKSIVINTVEYCKDPTVTADNSTNICRKLQALRYLGAAGSELRVDLTVEHPEVIHPPSTVCGPQATCGNGQCIPKSTVCEDTSRTNCSATSEEKSYHQNRKCDPNQFMCANRKCVLKTWLCDSEDDCEDGSDEQNCVESTSDQCRPSEFACASNDQCVSKSFHCDGQGDCLDESDEIGCTPVHVTTPPSPSNVKLNPGDTLTLVCKAVGVPVPLISWRLNWGHIPENCKDTSINGVGTLSCYNMQVEHSGAYTCEAINNKGTVFANHDAIVYVNGTGEVFSGGYFNSEARSPSECIRCFCFGKSTQCQSADLFIFNMPTPLGERSTRLVGVNQRPNGDVQVDHQQQYYYEPLRNGAMVSRLAELETWSRSSAHPYLTLPKTYNGNQLTSYGGHIKYRLSPHIPQKSKSDEKIADIIIKGTYQTLMYKDREDRYHEPYVNARLTPGDWQKPTPRGLMPASREDIMMALHEIETILLRADFNNAGVNITEFNMESAQSNNAGLGSTSMVEECSCPKGYKGRSCEKCADGFQRQNSGPWNGTCTYVRTDIVTGRPRLKQRLTVSSVSPTINEGQNIRVVCTGTDNIPAELIDWVRKDGTQFLSNVRSENGVLSIEYAVPENQGVYMCQAPPNYYMKPEMILLTVISLPSLEETTNITVSTDQITIPTGGSGTIGCDPLGYPLPLIKWTKYQQSFGPGTSQRENTLVINNAQDSDAGYYLCKGTVNGRTVVRKYVYVEIERREVPRVEIYPQGEMWVRLGTQYELHCIVEDGIPQPDVTWYRNGGKYFSEHVQTLQNNTLSFRTVEVNDEGEYTCTATNDAGSVSASTIINVVSPPVITISPNEYIHVNRGDRVQVICRADGHPEPEVSIESSTDRYLRVPPSLRSATLTIASASDDGNFTCTATSAAGTTEEQFVIRVDRDYDAYPDGSNDDPYDPNPPEHPSSMFAIEGQQIRITCDASEEFRVIWNRGTNQDLQNNAVQNGNELIINNTSKNDSGLYGCTLENLQTNEVQKSTQTILEVLTLPRITLRPPTQTVHSGQSPTVECIIEGDDIISVTWKPTNIAFSSRVENRGSTLIFHQIEVEDAGQYECLAMNRFGSTSAVAEVIVNGREAPRVEIYPQGERWVTLGTQYEVHCIVEDEISQPAVTWYRNGDKYFSEHVQILQNNTLSFQTVEVNDEGEYTCTATNDAGSVSASTIIKVGSPPVITISPNKYIRVIRGDSIEVICSADGYPEPEVSIESSTGRYIWVPPLLRSATLTIGSASDDGNYTCTATSAAGTTEEQFVIRVEGSDDAFPVTSAGLIRGCLYGGVALLWRKGLFPNVTMLDCGDNIQGYLDALISAYEERAEASRKKTSSHCGRRKITHTELIVNGSPTKAGDWPWHAALYRLDRSQIKYICGGTLISKYFVLTAAHCASIRGEMLLPETLSVILGKFNLVGGDIGTQEKEVHQIIIHNKFEYRHSNNDIALLKLRTEAVYTDYVQPACLWYPKVHEKLPTDEIFGAIVGWGFDITDNLSHQLRQAKMPVVSESTCIKSNPSYYPHILNDNKFCAGYKNGTSACNGDSGGAFQVFVPDKAKDNSPKAAGAWYIKGIVSITVARTDAPICDPEQYVVFTDVAKYLHWIENNTK